MSRPDEGLIHQWLDGECTPEEAARLEQLVATDAAWAAAVAEARGLIAASSRIVGALDAVPRAMPTTAPMSAATPKASPRAIRMPAWIGVAAGVVLVAGTAYVVRERSAAPFGVVSTPPAAQPAAMDTVPGVQVGRDVRAIVPPPTVPPSAAPTASGAADAALPSAPPAPPPAATEPPPAPVLVPRAQAEADARRAEIEASERSRRAPSRQGVLATEAPAARAASAVPAMLDGCWRVTAPPELVGVLVTPVVRRSAGDTLVLVTVQGDVTVVRLGDVLRGGLEAKQEPCRSPE